MWLNCFYPTPKKNVGFFSQVFPLVSLSICMTVDSEVLKPSLSLQFLICKTEVQQERSSDTCKFQLTQCLPSETCQIVQGINGRSNEIMNVKAIKL